MSGWRPAVETPDSRFCIVCHQRELRDDEPQTCRRCVTAVRQAVTEVGRLFTLLSTELEGRVGSSSGGGAGGDHPIPMGELISLMGPGANVSCRDGQPDDAPSAVGILAGWEDDWRQARGIPGAPYAGTVASAVAFLEDQTQWAASWHPAFDEYASELRGLRARILRALGLSDDPVRMGADCFECGSALVRDYAPRRHCPHGPDRHGPDCDQGGLRDWCRCVHCGQTYTAAQYHLALRAVIESARDVARVA